MRREHFEHVIAVAASVAGEQEIVVIGSQAILGSHPDPPEELLASMEADVYPLANPERADEIAGALGDGSPFQGTYGYYAHGVGPETVKAPRGWEHRLIRVPIPPRPGSEAGAIALCLESHDLVLSKCAAGRQRDWDFAREALKGGVVEYEELERRIDALPISSSDRDHVDRMLRGIASRLSLLQR